MSRAFSHSLRLVGPPYDMSSHNTRQQHHQAQHHLSFDDTSSQTIRGSSQSHKDSSSSTFGQSINLETSCVNKPGRQLSAIELFVPVVMTLIASSDSFSLYQNRHPHNKRRIPDTNLILITRHSSRRYLHLQKVCCYDKTFLSAYIVIK